MNIRHTEINTTEQYSNCSKFAMYKGNKSHRDNRGFSLVELIVVIGIMVVLVAVLAPLFVGYIEKARESTDVTNIRTQYDQVIAASVEASGVINKDGLDSNFGKIALKQAEEDWQGNGLEGLESIFTNIKGKPTKGGNFWVEFDTSSNTASLYFEAGASEESSKKAALPKVEYSQNATDEEKETTDNIAKAYSSISSLTEEYIANGGRLAAGGRDTDYRVYMVNEQGELVAEIGDKSKKSQDWASAYKMPTSGSATIDGKKVSWNAGDVVQIAYRTDRIDFGVAHNAGQLWGN